MDVLQRHLQGVGRAALTAVTRVPPRSDQPRPRRTEEDGETFALRIQLDLPVGSPLGGHCPVSDFDALEDPAESQVPRIEDPCAVT